MWGVCVCVCVQTFFDQYSSTLSHFENGRDVTAYFTLDRTEMHALLSIREKLLVRLQEGMVEMLVAGAYVETRFDVTSIIKVRQSLL